MQVSVAVWRCQSQNQSAYHPNKHRFSPTSPYFCNFYRQYRFYDVKAYVSLHLGHFTSVTFASTGDAVRRKTSLLQHFVLYKDILYFISTADHQSPHKMDNGIG